MREVNSFVGKAVRPVRHFIKQKVENVGLLFSIHALTARALASCFNHIVLPARLMLQPSQSAVQLKNAHWQQQAPVIDSALGRESVPSLPPRQALTRYISQIPEENWRVIESENIIIRAAEPVDRPGIEAIEATIHLQQIDLNVLEQLLGSGQVFADNIHSYPFISGQLIKAANVQENTPALLKFDVMLAGSVYMDVFQSEGDHNGDKRTLKYNITQNQARKNAIIKALEIKATIVQNNNGIDLSFAFYANRFEEYENVSGYEIYLTRKANIKATRESMLNLQNAIFEARV